MAEISIRFRMNLETGKKDLWIDFEGDEDLMRHEHEQRHREVIERLMGEGILRPDELGEVHVARVEPARGGASAAGEQAPPQAEANQG